MLQHFLPMPWFEHITWLLGSRELLRLAELSKNKNKIKLQQDKVRSVALKVMDISSSRHTTIWPDINYLNTLEFDLLTKGFTKKIRWTRKKIIKDEQEQLVKIRGIKIHAEYIEIAWYKLKRFDEKIDIFDDKSKDVSEWILKTKNWEGTLFEHLSAKKYASARNLAIPDMLQWNKITEAIPWRTGQEKIVNMIAILNLSQEWYLSVSGTLLPTYIWKWNTYYLVDNGWNGSILDTWKSWFIFRDRSLYNYIFLALRCIMR